MTEIDIAALRRRVIANRSMGWAYVDISHQFALTDLLALLDRLERAEAALRRMEDASPRSGQHLPGCKLSDPYASWVPGQVTCTCGLDAAKER